MDKSQAALLQQLLQLGDVTYIKKSNSNIIAAFASLDTEALTYLLDDNRTYQNATKAVFIEKVREVFEKFIEAGDTQIEPSFGKCCADACRNLGCTGYRFVGNNSRNHLDLIFDEKDGQIVDIFTCDDFQPDEDIVVADELDIDISCDERADFNPSAGYLLKSSKCRIAIEELGQPRNTILKAHYLSWLEKHSDLFSSFRFPPIHYRKYNDFYKLYSSIRFFFDWIRYESVLVKAMSDFQKLSLVNETELIQWLVAHEPLWNDVIGKSYDYDDHDNKLDVIGITYNPEFFVQASECSAVLDFVEIYQKHYWPVFHKCRTNTEEELYGITMSSEQWRESHSLTWHLKQKGLL